MNTTTTPDTFEALLALWNKREDLRHSDAPIAVRAETYFAMKDVQVRVLAASHTA